ncbi:MAG: FecR domain-containing protein [Deltaproteobacteria bacterium]|nr:FecR domain-containing protein [Deltaproteobacteria bacterium]
MACSERSALWGFAAGELAAEARGQLEQHLAGCESCRQELEAIQATREVLSLAVTVPPQVDWRRADDDIHGAVERRFARLERGWTWPMAWALGAGAVALVVAVMAVGSRGQKVDSSAFALINPLPTPSEVETAEGALVFVDGKEQLVKQGEDLKAGSAVRTTASGKAIFKLPEGSRVRVASASDLELQRAAKDEVGLVLRKGRVAVQAAHVARKAFVVEAEGAKVRVVGTAFTVGLTEGRIDVAVAEGKVLVELPDGTDKPVRAGERLLIDRARSETLPSGLTQVDRSELGDLGVEVALAEVKKPRPTMPRQPVAVVDAAPLPPPTPAPEPVASPAADPLGLKPLPAQPLSQEKPQPEPLRGLTSTEGRMNQFDYAADKGRCAEYIEKLENDLEDIHEDQDLNFRERAWVFLARCYRGAANDVKATWAYRHYLDEFPKGKHADEARRFLPH